MANGHALNRHIPACDHHRGGRRVLRCEAGEKNISTGRPASISKKRPARPGGDHGPSRGRYTLEQGYSDPVARLRHSTKRRSFPPAAVAGVMDKRTTPAWFVT